MQIRFIRSDLQVSEAFDTEQFSDRIDRASGRPHWKLGAVIDETEFATQVLVGNGDAEPADLEAEKACPRWAINRENVLLSREMLAKGIDPIGEDRERFRNGELLGYDANGDDIPGPNWVEPEHEEDEQE
jgi:hypothetical protein